mgnify:CR=1 FL=1
MRRLIIFIMFSVVALTACKKEDIQSSATSLLISSKYNDAPKRKIKFCVKHAGNPKCATTPCTPCDCPLGVCIITTKLYGGGITADELADGYGSADAYFDTTNNEVMLVFDQTSALADSTIPVTSDNNTWDQYNDIVQDLGYDSIIFDSGTYTVNFDSIPYGFVELPYTAYE